MLAVFHKSLLMKDSFSLAVAIKSRLGATFNTSPIILPGDGAPPQIPKVIFKSENGIGLHVTQISTQLDISGESLTHEVLYEFLGIGNEVIDLVNKDFDCEVARIGVVLVGNLTLESSGAEFIKETYFKGFDEQLYGTEAHWLTRPMFGDENVNQWVRIKSDSNISGDANNFVEITIDSNIIQNLERTVSGDYAKDYLKACVDNMFEDFNTITKID